MIDEYIILYDIIDCYIICISFCIIKMGQLEIIYYFFLYWYYFFLFFSFLNFI